MFCNFSWVLVIVLFVSFHLYSIFPFNLFVSSPFSFLLFVYAPFAPLVSQMLLWQGWISRNFNEIMLCLVSMMLLLQGSIFCNFNKILAFASGKKEEQEMDENHYNGLHNWTQATRKWPVWLLCTTFLLIEYETESRDYYRTHIIFFPGGFWIIMDHLQKCNMIFTDDMEIACLLLGV